MDPSYRKPGGAEGPQPLEDPQPNGDLYHRYAGQEEWGRGEIGRALRGPLFGPRLRGRSLGRLHFPAHEEVMVRECVKTAVVRDPNDLDLTSYNPGFSDWQTFAASSGKLDFP